jgi:hypothetical protein
MKYIARIGFVLAAHCCISARAQTPATGTVRLALEPRSQVQYVLDGARRAWAEELVLPAGEHHFTFWAPNCSLRDTTIMVRAGSETKVDLRLQLSAEYLELERWKKRTFIARTALWAIPAAGVAIFGTRSVVSKVEQDDTYNDLIKARDAYASTTNSAFIVQLKTSTIPQLERKLAEQTKRLNDHLSWTAICAGAALAGAAIGETLRPPDYQDHDRLKFEGLVWVPGVGGGVLAAGITWHIR